MMNDSPCPCGSGQNYAACCGRFLNGQETPPTAEALMRSRYSAFTLGDESYLLQSWHPSTRPATLSLSQQSQVKWIGLKILSTQLGGKNDREGTVEFVARYKVNGKAERLHEISRFNRENARWFYVDGKSDIPG